MAALVVEQLDELRVDPGRGLLVDALAGLDDGIELLRLATGLRARGHEPELVSAVLEQAGLRRRARSKFGPDAERMFFTAAGLEQSTRADVAAHRAARFAAVAPDRLVDLCCGVGGDLMALAVHSTRAVGVDIDPLTAAIARANLAALGFAPKATVRVDDATTTDISGFDAAFIDPARRAASGRRTFDPRAYSPPFSFVTELATRIPASCAKVAPGLAHALVPADAEAEWVSSDGDVTELALWFGPFAEPSVHRRATLLPSGATLTDADPSSTVVGALPSAGSFVHEPDGAVVRAGLVGAVVAGVDGWLLDPAIAYVVTEADVRSSFTRRYAVRDVLPFQLKRLRAHLRSIGTGDVVVKKRGNAVDPEELRARLRLDGDGPTRTLLLTRVGTEPFVIVADPD
jgi:hypothetical protein